MKPKSSQNQKLSEDTINLFVQYHELQKEKNIALHKIILYFFLITDIILIIFTFSMKIQINSVNQSNNDLNNTISSTKISRENQRKEMYHYFVNLYGKINVQKFYLTEIFQSKEEFLAFFQNIINKSSSSISTLNLISSFLYNNLKKNRPNEKMNEKFYLKMSLKIMRLLYENPKSLTKKNKERDTLVKIFLIINELLSLPTKEKTESEVEFSKKKAHLNRKVIIPLSKELLLNENRVKIIKISNKLFEDTEIVCLASKILRKAFLSVLTDKYLSKKEKESFDQFTFELKGFLLKEAPFSKYLSVLLNMNV